MLKVRGGIMLKNNVLISSVLCKKYNTENDSIEQILSNVKIDENSKANFCYYLEAKIQDEEKYHIYIFLRNEKRYSYIGEFTIPQDGDSNIKSYRIVYNMNNFYFPDTGEFEFIVFGFKEEESKVYDDDDKNCIYNKIKDKENNILDVSKFNVYRFQY